MHLNAYVAIIEVEINERAKMSVTLREVIEAGGYDLSTVEDANWLLATQVEYEQLIEKAQELLEEEL